MRSSRGRIAIVVGALLGTTACATGEEWATWRGHPAHFASGHHMAFSVKNRSAPPLVVAPRDLVAAEAERWWGGPFAPAAPPADVAGRWIGTWSGRGVMTNRTSRAEARFTQAGRRADGRLILADTLAAEVPDIVKWEGARGVDVVLEVGAHGAVVRDVADGRLLRAVLVVDGDRLTGRVEGAGAPVHVALTRAR